MNDWREAAHAPATGTPLCRLEEVPDGGGHEVSFGGGPEPFRILLLRLGEDVFAYHNRCPHFSLPLNYEPQVFHVYDREYLMCAHHTALFKVASGECFDGPCAGQRLTAIPVRIEEGMVSVA
ncbi:MAG TPA: Rieske (2Fe-2S) protein [Burkholderiales bacterium]|jgi:nitrite reductase/ring-hydroxylating ferredoxin subunit|nr:Rieske (2Fe-2S) protein [Burkholderiales bacterium]